MRVVGDVVSALLSLPRFATLCTWFDESIGHCHSASTVMRWPMGWTISSHKFGARRVNWGQARCLHRNRPTLKMAHGCQMTGRAAFLTCPAL